MMGGRREGCDSPSFSVIGGITALSLVAAFMSAFLLSRLRRQFGRVQRLGAYTLERKISEGGMATIHLARHALLKRPTAIKILKKHVATDEFIHRFEREVQLASQLLHPNTVEIYDFGRTAEGQPYYVMEYLDGVTLAELEEFSGRVPPGRAIHILRQVAAALREAHLRGMIHRDVKPENVMLCRRGEDDVVKLLDFGLVKNLEGAETRDLTRQLSIIGFAAHTVILTDTLPAEVTLISTEPTVGSCDQDGDQSPVVCQLGSMASGDSATVTIVVRLVQESSRPLANQAEVAAVEPDHLPANNIAAAVVNDQMFVFLPLVRR